MTKEEEYRRKQIHEVLDLVLDINGMRESCAETTGNQPTVFFNFSGHVAMAEVRLFSNGWIESKSPDARFGSSISLDDYNGLPVMIKMLKDFKEGMTGKDNGAEQC